MSRQWCYFLNSGYTTSQTYSSYEQAQAALDEYCARMKPMDLGYVASRVVHYEQWIPEDDGKRHAMRLEDGRILTTSELLE